MSGESYCPECSAVFTGLPHDCPKARLLLTEEEILKVLDRIPQVKAGDSLIPMVEASAEAQLKKVVEWAYMPCTEHSVSDVISLMRKDCPKCWQTLLEEVKE